MKPPQDDFACCAVNGKIVALLHHEAVHAHLMRGVIDLERPASRDADLPHLACDQRGVRRHAAAGGENSLGSIHPLDVFGRGFHPDENNLISSPLPFFRFGCREDRLPCGGPWTGIEALREEAALLERPLLFFAVEDRAQELVQLFRFHPGDRLSRLNKLFADHFDCNPKRRDSRPLAVPRLQHVELSLFDRELEILHVPVVPLQLRAYAQELVVDFWKELDQRRDIDWRADAGDDIFSLGIHEKLAVEPVLAGCGIPRECDPRSRVIAHVSEYHRLNVDRRTPVLGYLIELPVRDGAFIHPGAEDRIDSAPELIMRILREGHAKPAADFGLERPGEVTQIATSQLGIAPDTPLAFFPFNDQFEGIPVILTRRLQAEDDISVHLDEPTVRIVGEPFIAGSRNDSFHGRIVQTQIQDRIHHPRHRSGRSGADRHQQGFFGIAEFFSRKPLDTAQRCKDVLAEPARVSPAVEAEVGAHLCGDRETRRHRKADVSHLGKIRPFTPEQHLHVGAALRPSAAKRINIFTWPHIPFV